MNIEHPNWFIILLSGWRCYFRRLFNFPEGLLPVEPLVDCCKWATDSYKVSIGRRELRIPKSDLSPQFMFFSSPFQGIIQSMLFFVQLLEATHELRARPEQMR